MREVTTILNYISGIFLVVALALARPVSAENSGKCLGKLSTLQNELIDYQQSSRRWAAAWGATWSAATASQLIVAANIHDIQTRKDLWVGSASSALGIIPTWIIPPEATRDFALGDCEAQLSQAESLAKRLSADTDLYNGTTAQIGNITVNLTTSLILGLAFGHWQAAAISFAAGIPLGEVMILTYPKFSEFEDGLHKVPGVTMIPSPTGPALAFSFAF